MTKTQSSAQIKSETVAPAANVGAEDNKANWSEILVKISERSQKVINEFLKRADKDIISNYFPPLDVARLTEAYTELMNRVLKTPDALIDSHVSYWKDYIKLCRASIARFSGETEVQPVIEVPKSDKRFKDDAWQQVWFFDFIKQSYLLTSKLAQTVSHQAQDLDPKMSQKVDFYTRQVIDAMAPNNFWMTNPEVLRATVESKGENLIKGLENLLKDFERGRGELALTMSKNSAFKFGENIAVSKGKVIFQNDLIQLIQYAPLTETVYKKPLLIVPPWINKYYILDLREKNSYIRYAVSQGNTVFCISWVNPDERHADINFDDYMSMGVLEALKAIKTITGENEVNTIGYCMGGTLLASAIAYLNGLGGKCPADVPLISSATYLVTLVDFSEPGEIGVFIDEKQISLLENHMAKQGYLGAPTINLTFNLLRANDLLWSFVINNYLLAKEPFPFDLLTWNSDTTNLPAKMHSYYLRNMYLKNDFIKPNALTMKGVPIDINAIDTPSFILGTREDHITPWRAVYKGTQVYKGDVKFILSKSGHIAGVINPPEANKYGYWTNDTYPDDPEKWLDSAESHDGSWWPTWSKWLETYAGEKIPARNPGDNATIIEEAPGSYVRVRVL